MDKLGYQSRILCKNESLATETFWGWGTVMVCTLVYVCMKVCMLRVG